MPNLCFTKIPYTHDAAPGSLKEAERRLAKVSIRAPTHAVYFAPYDAIATSKEVIINAGAHDPRFDKQLRKLQDNVRLSMEELEAEINRLRVFQTAHRLIGVE